MKNYFKMLFAAIGSALAIKLNGILVTESMQQYFSLLLSAAFGVFVSVSLEYLLLQLPMHIPYVRRRLEPAARFEGLWVFEPGAQTQAPYCYAWFRYDLSTNACVYSGLQFFEDGEVYAQWTTTRAFYDNATFKLKYFWMGRKQNNAQQYEGHGEISFLTDKKGGCRYAEDF